jgi:peptidoglycan LD-endopeptidase LytH
MTPPRCTTLAVALAVLLLAKSSAPLSAIGPAPPPAAAFATGGARHEPTVGQEWLDATRAALEDALEVPLPFAEVGGGAADATSAFAVEALGGQTLEIALERQQAAGGRIYVEVFRVVEVLGEVLHERLATLRPSAERLRTRLPSDGTYHVLVQPEHADLGPYRLTIELGAALPFPVPGVRADAIRSLFGASRDAGQRYHAGVDIFVQRLTPVLAVAAGRAMPRRDSLGGNAVWLNTPGTSYYYAHLDRIAVRDEQSVKVGDVLGYVGNTGNARNEPSHLHFGVYRWGREPVDPLPLLVGRRFAGATPPATLATDAG